MALSLVAAAIASCGPASVPTASPSSQAPNEFQVALPPNVTVTVVDQTGAVLAVEPWIPAVDDFMPEFDRGPVSVVSGRDFVRVAWLGRPCDTRPTVVISGDMAETQVDFFSGPLPTDVACPDLGVTRGVDLTVTAVPDALVPQHHEGTPP
jgi:hypothetical protein